MDKYNNILEVPGPRLSRESMLAFKKQCHRKHEDGKCLTLEETAFAIWDPEKEAHPITPMGVLKIERRALEKVKLALKKYGINNLDDVFDPKHRELAKQDTTREY